MTSLSGKLPDAPPAEGTGSTEIDRLIEAYGYDYAMDPVELNLPAINYNHAPLKDARTALIAAIREVVRDAERYRFMRDTCEATSSFKMSFHVPSGDADFDYEQNREWMAGISKEALDSLIDVAIQQPRKEAGDE